MEYEEIIKTIEKFEKDNTKVLKTEDIVNEKIIIADYIKWDDFRKLKSYFKATTSLQSNKSD